MAFDVQTLNEAARCAECLSPNQKQNVLLYLLNGILEGGSGGTVLHNLLSLTHPDTVPGPPTRGALVVGNATPDWESLPIGAANRVLRSDGVDATWSQLVLTTDVTGILLIANGGTNSSAALNNNRIMVSSGGAIVEAAALTDGQLLIGSTGAAPVAASLTAGANITITPGAGSITIAATIGTHTILDAVVHTDSVTQAVTRGSLIYGNSTPKWDELTIGAAGRFLGSDGTDVSWTVLPGSFSGFANPTASVGLVAVNGVATTAMRSDAAPPLSQAIAPTWTGPHIFSPTAALAIQLNPFGAAAGNTSELRFLELAASGTNYTGFKAADAMAASEIYVLPDAAPSANRFLRAGAVAAGVSTLSWAQISLTADVTGILPVANGGTGTGTAFTAGSVIFAGAAGVYTQDNANFFFDNANNRLGLVTAVPLYTLHVLGPGSFQYGFAAGALVLGADLNATTITVNSRKIGRVNMVSYDGGATNTFLFGGDFTTGANDIYFGGVTAGSQYAATAIHFFTGATQTTTGGIEKFTVNASGVQLPPTGVAAGNTGELRFLELAAGGTNYAGFRAADAMAASEIYVLPNAAPAGNRFLQAAAVAGGVSALSWAQVSLTADVTGILPVANGGSGTSAAFTAGSVIFAGASGTYAQDNANFFWDDTGNQLRINQLVVPKTTSSTVGGIYFAAGLAIHNFGVSNFFLGMSGNLTMTGANNAAIGDGALNANTAGNGNMAMGVSSLLSNTTGSSNVGIGFQALLFNTIGENNIAIGRSALQSNTEGILSVAIGNFASFSNTTGIANCSIGHGALQSNVVGEFSVAVGYNALVLNTSSNGVAIGAYALSLSTGANNIAIGFRCGDNLTTGTSNIAIGYDIDFASVTQSNTLAIGNLIFGTDIYGTGNIGIGVITPLAKFHVTNSAAATVATIIKAAAAQSANLTEWQSSAAVANTVINAAGNINIPTTTATVGIIFQNSIRLIHTLGTNNLFVGSAAGNFTMTGTGCVAFGELALNANTSGIRSVAIGYGALTSNTSGNDNVAIGYLSLLSNTTGNFNMALGYSSLRFNTTGERNTAFGYQALTANTIGNDNIAVGFQSMATNVDGISNTSIGYQSMQMNVDGDSNSAFGVLALAGNVSGNSNIAFGNSSLLSNDTGGFNIGIGALSLLLNTSGNNNIAIGSAAGNNLTTGSNNIAIGHDIDSPTATNSNTLTIGNLIFGAGVDGTGTTLSSGGVGIGVITPTAKLHLRAGTTAASTAPLKFNTGTSMTAAEAGAVEFTTDDLFFTITTGAARKRLLMADATAGLTSGKIPIATTNGRLADLTASAAYTPTNVTTDRAFDANATSVDELGDVLGTLIADLQAVGVLG